MNTLWLTLRETAKLAGSQRKLWVPFALTAFVEALFLVFIWAAPQPPFSHLLAPPIRYFFGEHVLHYPLHLWFLYHVMAHTHLIASILAGAFMSGIACLMVRQTHEARPLSLRAALVSRQVRYGTVLLVWISTWALAKMAVGALVHAAPKSAGLWSAIGATVFIQVLLAYAIPAAVFEGSTWRKALSQSVRETGRYPLSTAMAVIVPSAAAILLAFLASPARVAQWMAQTAPEIAFVFVIGRLLVWTAADAVMTVAVAHLWWIHRAQTSQEVSVTNSSATHQLLAVKGGPAVA